MKALIPLEVIEQRILLIRGQSEAGQLVSQNVIPHKKYFGGSLFYAFIE